MIKNLKCVAAATIIMVLVGSLPTFAAKKSLQEKTFLKAMSFNMRFDTPKDTAQLSWAARQKPIQRMMKEIKPDVVGVQELTSTMTDSLYSLLPEYGHYRFPLPSQSHKSPDIAVLYKKDRLVPLDSGYFFLSATPDTISIPWDSTDKHVRGCVWVKLHDRLSGKDIYYFSTHMPYKKAKVDTKVRAQCASLINSKIKEIAGDGAIVFVAGDMNAGDIPADPRSPSLTPFFDYMKSARRAALFTNNRSSFNGFGKINPKIRDKNLDHIFYRNAEPILFETIDYPGYGALYISDHYPIMAHFKL